MQVDSRHLPTGRLIPTQSYSDQPFVVRTDDGAWLCCVTTGPGHEGQRGQHVSTMRSVDQGRTWCEPVPVEGPESPENSYAVMLKVPSGRIYIFYNHNTDNVREVKRHDGRGAFSRVDSLGYYVFRYSDDHGRSWSDDRYVVGVREFATDRENVYGGALQFFWNVGKPFIHEGAAYLPLSKVGEMGDGFFARSECVLVRCPEMVLDADPAGFTYETLPDGEVGLRTPPGGGPIAEEQSFVVLSDGSFYAIYRSIDGYPVEAYSRDGGHTWTEPRYARLASGQRIKQPRAATFVWKTANGKYLLWHHNHGGAFVRKLWGQESATNGLVAGGASPYDDRNPVWLSGGVERETEAGLEIGWLAPEIVLYDDDPFVRISYPDLVEEDGATFVTETQKEAGRVHAIDAGLLAAAWGEPEEVSEQLLLAHVSGVAGESIPAPILPELVLRDHGRGDFGTKDMRGGFSFVVRFMLTSLDAGQILCDTRVADGRGWALVTTDNAAIELVMNDGRSESRWATDPGLLAAGTSHRATVIVDGGPKVILWVVDGLFCDGGEARQFGWGRYSPNQRTPNGGTQVQLAAGVQALDIYGTALKVNTAIQLQHSLV